MATMISVREIKNKDSYNSLLKILACICLAAISFASHADTFTFIESKPISELWLNAGLRSYHLKSDKGQNNNNFGIGGEYRFSTVSSVTVGVFNNSFRETSHYAGLYWQPLGVGPFRLGAAAGIVNGYRKERNGDWFFLLIPAVSFEYRRIGANLIYVPSHAKDGGAISLQLKLNVL